jgi:valyl-tRNA synthetase
VLPHFVRERNGSLSPSIARVDQKLNNENFVSRAPEDVVQELRDKRVEHEGTRAKVAEALKRLG